MILLQWFCCLTEVIWFLRLLHSWGIQQIRWCGLLIIMLPFRFHWHTKRWTHFAAGVFSLTSVFLSFHWCCAFFFSLVLLQLLHQLLDKSYATWRSSYSISSITKWACINGIDSDAHQFTGNISFLVNFFVVVVVCLHLFIRRNDEDDFYFCCHQKKIPFILMYSFVRPPVRFIDRYID